MNVAINKVKNYSLFSEFDIELLSSGKHFNLFEKFGSHILEHDGENGCYFLVYAHAARLIEVIGDFNHWNGNNHTLNVRWDGSGIVIIATKNHCLSKRVHKYN